MRVMSGCLRERIWRLATVHAVVKQECVFSDDDAENVGKGPRVESPTLRGSCEKRVVVVRKATNVNTGSREESTKAIGKDADY